MQGSNPGRVMRFSRMENVLRGDLEAFLFRLLAHAAQGHIAVAIASKVDSAEFTVVSVRKASTLRLGGGDEPLVREARNHLPDPVLFQDGEIAVSLRKAVLAVQAARISGRQSPSHGRQVA